MLSNINRASCGAFLRQQAPVTRAAVVVSRPGTSGRSRNLVAFCTASATNAELKIAIEGMMCGGCSSRIENVLKGMDTVQTVSVNLEGKVAVVKLAKGAPASPEAAAAAAALVDTINGLGFEAKLSS